MELNPGNAQMLADHADVVAMLQGQSMLGEPTKLFERALVLDPNNLKALALAGSAAFEKKEFAKAVQFWSKAQGLAPPGSDFAKGLASSVEEARLALGQTGISPAVAKAAPTPALVAANIQGVVSLSAAMKSKVAPDDTVFIYARATSGPRMPLAIMRSTVRQLPVQFSLDDSSAMSPTMKLSAFDKVVVVARVSRSGNPAPQKGDLEGVTSEMAPRARGLKVEISSTIN